jgi:glyoxalase/bleomycin resistance protein/dioxygenase superfamily protein
MLAGQRPQMLEGAFQCAYITADMDKATAYFAEQYDVGPFGIHDVSVACADRAEPCVIRVGVDFVGPTMIELVQPVEGAIEIYAEPRISGASPVAFHHLGLRVRGDLDTWTARRRECLDLGARIALEGGHADTMRFAYFDTRAELGHYVELIWLGAPFLSRLGAS